MNTSAQLEISLKGGEGTIDRAAILDRVGGDEDLLREITAIFLEEYPSLLKDIHWAVKNHDAKALERSAHALKGSVANFGARAATHAAYRLETMGRAGDLAEATSAANELTRRFEELHPLLVELAHA